MASVSVCRAGGRGQEAANEVAEGWMKQLTRAIFDPPLDPGIEFVVNILAEGGIETFESCEGGVDHAYPEPTVRFHGGRADGYKALAIVLQHNLPIRALRRIWVVTEGEATGPYWEIVLWKSTT